MVDAAHQYPLIREFTTTTEEEVNVAGRLQQFRNTNVLIKNPAWEIGLSKTGFINEAGRCLVMQAWINSKPSSSCCLIQSENDPDRRCQPD